MKKNLGKYKQIKEQISKDVQMSAYDKLIALLKLRTEIESEISQGLQNISYGVDIEFQHSIKTLTLFVSQELFEALYQVFLDTEFSHHLLKRLKTQYLALRDERDVPKKISHLRQALSLLEVEINIGKSMLTFDTMMTQVLPATDLQSMKAKKNHTLKIQQLISEILKEELAKYDIDDAIEKTHRSLRRGFHEITSFLLQFNKIQHNCQQILDEHHQQPYELEFISKVIHLQKFIQTHLKQLREIEKLTTPFHQRLEACMEKKNLTLQESALDSFEKELVESRNQCQGWVMQTWLNDIIHRILPLRGHLMTKKRYMLLLDQTKDASLVAQIKKMLNRWDKFLMLYPEDIKKRKKHLQILLHELEQINTDMALQNMDEESIGLVSVDIDKMKLKIRDLESTLKIDYPFHYHEKILQHPLTKLKNPQFVKNIQYALDEEVSQPYLDVMNMSEVEEIEKVITLLEKIDWAKRSFHDEPMRSYVEYWLEHEKHLPFFTWLQTQNRQLSNEFDILGIEVKNAVASVSYHEHITYEPTLSEDGLLYFSEQELKEPMIPQAYISTECPYVFTENGQYKLQSSDQPYWELMADDMQSQFQGTLGMLNGQVKWLSNQYQQYGDNPFAQLALLRHLSHGHEVDASKMGVKLYVHYDTDESTDLGYEQSYYFDNAQQVLDFFEQEHIDPSTLEDWEVNEVMTKLSKRVTPAEISTKVWSLDQEFNQSSQH